MSGLNEAQIEVLLRPIKPSRVMQAQGQSHVPAYDVAAHLTRVLGFGNWDTELLSKDLLFETDVNGDGKRWTVGYSATVRLTIKDTQGNPVAHWDNSAAGDALNQPSRADAHHLAMTTAISTAMKRCAAFGLGDQFGLSLYNKGSQAALIGKTLVSGGDTDLESHIAVPESLGNDERQAEIPISDPSPPTVARMALQASQGNPGPSETILATFPGSTVEAPSATTAQIGKIRAMLGKGADVHAEASRILKRDVTSLNDLTKKEASHVIENLS